MENLLKEINFLANSKGVDAWVRSRLRLLHRAVRNQEAKIQRMNAERLMVDRRIRNQRKAWRDTWEIIEMRAGHKVMPQEVRSRMLTAWSACSRERDELRRKLAALGHLD